MDFRLGTKSEEFREELRAFLDEHYTDEIAERVYQTGTIHDWGFHRALGERGWIGASFPKDYGGQERDPYEMTAFDEERARLDLPLDGYGVSIMIANVLRHCGTEEQKRGIIPGVLAGELLICLGYSEPECGSDVAAAKTRAVRDGDEWIVNGSKMFTTLAHESQYVFLLARTNNDVAKHKGLTTFLVPMDLPGIEFQPVHTLGGERTNITFYDDVRVPDRWRVGDVDSGWDVMMVALTFERGGSMGGQIRRLLANAVEAVRTIERNGRPLIEDPLVRERLARAEVETEVSNLLGLRTTWLFTQGILPGVEGSMGKLFSSEAFVRASSDLLDLLGPEGLLQHGEPTAPAHGHVEHEHRHATVTTIYGGTSEVQRNIIAQRGLGLPRAR